MKPSVAAQLPPSAECEREIRVSFRGHTIVTIAPHEEEVRRMATSAYLSPGPPPLSDQEERGGEGVMNLVNPAVSQSYSVPREQVVRHRNMGAQRPTKRVS